MDWIVTLASNAAVISAIGLCVAAWFTCWRAGTLHPIRSRLLRLFIAKDDIQDTEVKALLSDHAALTSYRTTFGIHADTLDQAKAIGRFANANQLPLELIGHAGKAFNGKTLKLVDKHIWAKPWLILPMLALLAIAVLLAFFLLVACSSNLLVSLKATDTSIWLNQESAQLARPFGERNVISASSCKANSGQIPRGFTPEDQAALCRIWAEPTLKAHLDKSISDQRMAAWMSMIFLAWLSYLPFSLLRQWASALALKCLLVDAEANEEQDLSSDSSKISS